MKARIFDDRRCELGEGPLWHPERKQFFWFDITGKRLLSRTGDGPQEWSFNEMCSAAGWVDGDTLLMASETGLWRFVLSSGEKTLVTPLEADNAGTRSNDGRADPFGGFWIGTMGLNAEPGAGAIYRYYRGELRQLFPKITIPNAMCFAPDRSRAYFADTVTNKVMRVALDADGWPAGAPQIFLETEEPDLHPDGAVTDAAGNLWLARWGASRVACYSTVGSLLQEVSVGGRHSSCPAFGGSDFTDLYVTTAMQGISLEDRQAEPGNGMTYIAKGAGQGMPEPRVIL
jgi:sugar lactone lactonase YvrE